MHDDVNAIVVEEGLHHLAQALRLLVVRGVRVVLRTQFHASSGRCDEVEQTFDHNQCTAFQFLSGQQEVTTASCLSHCHQDGMKHADVMYAQAQ